MGHIPLFAQDFAEKYHSRVRHSVGHPLIHCNALQGVGFALGLLLSPSSTNLAVWTVATEGTIGTLMYIAAASSSPKVWSSVTFQRDG